MRSISDVTREHNVTDYMLREWEKKGYLGNVAQINGKRMYEVHQIDRILFLISAVEEQRKQGIKRTEYSKIEEAMFDRFGGEVVIRETALNPNEIFGSLLKQLKNNDEIIKKTLFDIYAMVADLKEQSNESPNSSKYVGQLEKHNALVGKYNELGREYDKTRKENEEIKKELQDLKSKRKFSFWKRSK